MATPAQACSCVGTGSACSALSATPVVFVGRVTKDSTDKLGQGFGRMLVEEVLHGLPNDIGEVEVDTMAGTSCYMRLEEGSRVVLYGSRDPKNARLIHYHACSFSFRVDGNEALLDALRNAEAGGPPRLVGTVNKRIEQYGGGPRAGAGIKVIAEKDGERLETTTTGDGQFEFRVISPGAWKLNIESAGLLHDSENEYPKTMPRVPLNGCEARGLSAVADGHIRGTVKDNEGRAVAGVLVQVFNFDKRRNEFETLKFAEAKTGDDGSYDIGGLPPQEYILGVNAEKYHDRIAYPPAYYGSTARNEAKPITLKEAEQLSAFDLVLSAPRRQVTLILDVRNEDGSVATATGIPKTSSDPQPPVISSMGANANDINDIQRGFASVDGPISDGKVRLSLWSDEIYRIRVFRLESGPMIVNPDGSVRGNFKNWEGTGGPIRLMDAETTLRVVLSEKPLGGK